MAFAKIEEQLRHEDPVVRKKSLLAVRELLKEPLPAASCTEARVPLALLDLLHDPDADMRCMAATSLEIALQYDVACVQVLEHARLPDLVDLIDDPEPSVRESAYRAMIEACRFESVRAEMAGAGSTLPRVVGKLLSETHGPLVDLALRLLDTCLNARRNDEALRQCTNASEGLSCCHQLLDVGRPASTRELAALLLARLCNTQFDSKVKAVELGCVPLLVGLLQHPVLAIKLAASTALMSLTTVNEAKDAFFENDGCSALMRLIKLRHEVTRIHVITLLTNLGEHVGCRAQLQPAVPYLQEILDSTGGQGLEPNASNRVVAELDADPKQAEAVKATDTLRRFAAQAIRQLTFVTRPFELLPVPAGNAPSKPITNSIGASGRGAHKYEWESESTELQALHAHLQDLLHEAT